MLQNIREHATGWGAKIVVALIAISFVIFGSASLFAPSSDGKVVLSVNGDEIHERRFDATLRRTMNQYDADVLANIPTHELRQRVEENIINELLLKQKAKKLGLYVATEKVIETIKTIPVFQVEGQFSEANYQRFLGNMHYTHQEFVTELQSRILNHQLQQGVAQSTIMSDWEIDTFIKKRDESRRVKYHTLLLADYTKGIEVGTDEISAYYQANQNNFMVPEQISLEYVRFSADEILSEYPAPSPTKIKAFYDAHTALYDIPERVKVAHILVNLDTNANQDAIDAANTKIKAAQAALAEGKSFAEVAKEYSDDLESAPKGGELDWITPGEVDVDFEKAAFALTKKDEVSNIVTTPFGLHVIKLLGREDRTVKPLAEVKEDVIKRMQDDWLRDRVSSVTDEMVTLAFDYPESLQPIAETLKLKIYKSKPFSKDEGSSEEHLQHENISKAAFSHEVKELRNNSDIIAIDNKDFFVIRLKEAIPARQQQLEEVAADIKTLLTNQQATQNMQSAADKIVADINNSDSIIWKQALLTRNSADVNESVVTKAFSLPNPNFVDFKPVGSVIADGDVVVVWVQESSYADNKVSPQERQYLQQFFERNIGQLEFSLMLKSWEAEAEITKN